MSTARCICLFYRNRLADRNRLKVLFAANNTIRSLHEQRQRVYLQNTYIIQRCKRYNTYGITHLSRNFSSSVHTTSPLELENLSSEVLTSSVSLQNSHLPEPAFESIGLGGPTPAGFVQKSLEYLHISCDLPWWGCIAIGTCVIRLLIFPLVVLSQKHLAVMSNTMPQIQLLQMKMTDARKRGNPIEAMQYSREMMSLISEKNINPVKSFMIPMVQMPIFLSFFFGLRGMAELPVESLHSGGFLWFPDLTLPDPYLMLPLITSATMFLTIELGMDTGISPNQMQNKVFKYIFRSFPIILFPFATQFPGVILVYWVSTNLISLVQMRILRIEGVRNYFGIEKVVPFKMNFQMPTAISKTGFTDGLKESMSNMSITHEIDDRKRVEMLEKRQKNLKAEKKKVLNK